MHKKKSSFLKNLHALAWYGSYKLWLSREDAEFPDPPFIPPHIDINTTQHTMYKTGSQEVVEGMRTEVLKSRALSCRKLYLAAGVGPHGQVMSWDSETFSLLPHYLGYPDCQSWL